MTAGPHSPSKGVVYTYL